MIEVKLTDEEKRMLQGERGSVRQTCMAYLVEMAQIAGAERLVDIDGTGDMHAPGLTMSPYYIISIEELRELVESGGRFAVPTFEELYGIRNKVYKACGLLLAIRKW